MSAFTIVAACDGSSLLRHRGVDGRFEHGVLLFARCAVAVDGAGEVGGVDFDFAEVGDGVVRGLADAGGWC